MFPVVSIGPLAVQVPGVMLLIGVWAGIQVMEREATRHKLPASSLSNLVLFGLLAGVIGARLGYALRFLEAYGEDPLGLLSLNPSTLSPMEGVLAGLLTAWIYGTRKGLSFWSTLDALTPGLAVFGVALGLSHLASGDAYGAPASLPWAIELWGARRHPTQVYEILAAVLILLALWRFRRWDTFPGFFFLCWVLMAAVSRLILEAFRGDSAVIFGVLRGAQIGGLLILLMAMSGLHFLARGSMVEGGGEGLSVSSDEPSI